VPFTLQCGDLTDAINLIHLIQETQHNEIYNLATESRETHSRRDFATRKITRAVAAIAPGRQRTLQLGNLNAKRD
jgi:GDP-D-mannose dehydratase